MTSKREGAYFKRNFLENFNHTVIQVDNNNVCKQQQKTNIPIYILNNTSFHIWITDSSFSMFEA